MIEWNLLQAFLILLYILNVKFQIKNYFYLCTNIYIINT